MPIITIYKTYFKPEVSNNNKVPNITIYKTYLRPEVLDTQRESNLLLMICLLSHHTGHPKTTKLIDFIIFEMMGFMNFTSNQVFFFLSNVIFVRLYKHITQRNQEFSPPNIL